MGNKNSVTEHIEFDQINEKYEFEKKYTDDRLGEVKVLTEKETGIKIYQKDFNTNSRPEFDAYVEDIKKRTQLSHPNLLRVLGYNSKKEDLFCADNYKVSIFFETFDHDLKQEIQRKIQRNENFEEPDLWYIFDSVVSAGAFLQQNNLYHGDIRPYNIFVNGPNDYKISDTGIFKQNYNPAFIGALGEREAKQHYPSPQVMETLKNEDSKTPSDIDYIRNDIFALGMTILEAAHLKNVDIYDWENSCVVESKLQEALEKMKQNYSDTLIDTLKFTLNISEGDRPDFTTLDQELAPYRKDIRARIAHGIAQTGTALHYTQSPPKVQSKPVYSTDYAERRQQQQDSQQQPAYGGKDEYDYEDRVQRAIKRSEETIFKNSPSKYRHKDLDPYIDGYLKKSLNQQAILRDISQYISMDNKYVATLAQYPDEETLRASQMLRRSQFAGDNSQYLGPQGNDSLKVSGIVGGQKGGLATSYDPNQYGAYAQNPSSYRSYGGTGGQTNYNYGANYGVPSSNNEAGADPQKNANNTTTATNYNYGNYSAYQPNSSANQGGYNMDKEIEERIAKTKALLNENQGGAQN